MVTKISKASLIILLCTSLLTILISFLIMYNSYVNEPSLKVYALLVSDIDSNISFMGAPFIFPRLNKDGSFKELDVIAYDYEEHSCSIIYNDSIAFDVDIDNLSFTGKEYEYLTSEKTLSPIEYIVYLFDNLSILGVNADQNRFIYLLIANAFAITIMLFCLLIETAIRLISPKVGEVARLVFALLYVSLGLFLWLGLCGIQLFYV